MKFGNVKEVSAATLKKDYVSHDYQRELRPAIIKDCIENMRREGFWKSHPVVYFRHDGKNMVVWGHHRREAAMKLGLSAYVVEMIGVAYEETVQLITDENWSTWKLKETLFREIQAGNQDYIRLYGYVKRGLTISCAASLLAGESGTSANQNTAIKKGTFAIKTTQRANQLVGVIERHQKNSPSVRVANFIKALARCLNVVEFELPVFEKKIELSPIAISRRSTIDDFAKAIEDTYNFQSRKPIPLAFMAEQEARRRSAIIQKKKAA